VSGEPGAQSNVFLHFGVCIPPKRAAGVYRVSFLALFSLSVQGKSQLSFNLAPEGPVRCIQKTFSTSFVFVFLVFLISYGDGSRYVLGATSGAPQR